MPRKKETENLTPEEQAFVAGLSKLSKAELAEMARQQLELEKRLALAGPRTRDELHAWIKTNLKFDIPRVSVCDGHQSPFEFLADLYFGDCLSAVAMANRGGSKTFLVAMLHYLNSRFKPGIESCVTADTLVDCPRDHRRYPNGVPISQLTPGQLVWSYNVDAWKFELKRVKRVWLARRDAPILKLTLDSGDVVRATPDHRFLRRNGEWAELRDLVPGDSLMPLYRDMEPYVRVYPDLDDGGGNIAEARAVIDAVGGQPKGTHVHHVDEWRSNTSEANLAIVTPEEHAALHRGRTRSKHTRMKIATGVRKAMAEIEWTNEQRERMAAGGAKGGRASGVIGSFECSKCGTTFARMKGGRKPGRCPDCRIETRTCVVCGDSFAIHYRKANETCSRTCAAKKGHLVKSGTYNHKVVSIEPAGVEDVWDMEVEDNESFVAGGVVLHNCSVGAIEMQARRAYMHLQKLLDAAGKDEISSTTMIDTRWKNGSRVEVLPGTVSAVNGPHPAVVHTDEVELMDPEVFQESRNMSQGQNVNGNIYPAQDIITSTRKRGHGPMQQIIDSIVEAEIDGRTPPYRLYTWCVFEIAQNVPNCQIAYPNHPNPCDCHNVPSGRWPSTGKVRTLKDVCGGKFAKSQGFLPLNDIINTFTKTSIEVWEAQQECSRPSSEGLVVPQFDRQRHGVRKWDPAPELGPIFMSVDFGGTNPHAVNWYQLLRFDVDVQWGAGTKRIPAGSLVCFDEIYIAEIGNIELAAKIVEREKQWRKKHRKFKTVMRFGDIAAKAARLDFAAHEPPLQLRHYCTREIEEHIKIINEIVPNDKFYVDVERCRMFVEEIEAWHRDRNNDKLVDEFNHAMSNFRYMVANLRAIERKRNRVEGRTGGPKALARKRPESPVDASIRRSNDLPRSERWRGRFGAAGGMV